MRKIKHISVQMRGQKISPGHCSWLVALGQSTPLCVSGVLRTVSDTVTIVPQEQPARL